MSDFPTSFVVLRTQPSKAAVFVDHWSKHYDYKTMNLYDGSISGRITAHRIRRLYTWKNGMKLSTRKARSLERKIVKKITVIQRLRKQFNEATFNEHFGKLTVVWRTFLLHIIDPDGFPIFDQHVYRAYRYLVGLEQVGVHRQPKVTMTAYGQYMTFYEAMVRRSRRSPKLVDDALWSFGKFLSKYPGILLH
jgi:hypothetical protein